jgi:uncharacterized membrane protein
MPPLPRGHRKNAAAAAGAIQSAAKAFGIASDRAGVPFMVIGDRSLIGSVQIPRELPGLIKTHLDAGGVDWPTAGGIAAAVAPATDVAICAPATPCASPVAATQNGLSKTGFSNGYVLAIVIMVGMVGALVYAASVALRLLRQPEGIGAGATLSLAVPALACIGLGVAAYLAYVETQGVEAVCGPVGDCNAVQGSSYARLYGLIPIGVLGAAGYVAILAAWLWGRLPTVPWSHHMPVALFNMTLFGTLFSLYLTFLEPFVIKAVCAWCLASAVIMTLLLWIVTQGLRRQRVDAPVLTEPSVSSRGNTAADNP